MLTKDDFKNRQHGVTIQDIILETKAPYHKVQYAVRTGRLKKLGYDDQRRLIISKQSAKKFAQEFKNSEQ